MTLRNNPMRNGVVVWTCEQDKVRPRRLHRGGVEAWRVTGVGWRAEGRRAHARGGGAQMAMRAGLMVGDVVLSVESHLLDSIENLVEYVSEAQGVINMELAGAPRSQGARARLAARPAATTRAQAPRSRGW